MSKYIVYSNIIALLISTSIKVILILTEAPLIAFALVILFDSFVLAVGYIYFFLKKSTFKIWELSFDKSTAIGLLKDSWPLIFGGSIALIQARIDQIMLKEMLDSEAVGYYSVALRLIEIFGFTTSLLYNSLFPAIMKAKKYPKEKYYDRLLNFYRLNFIIFLIIAIPIYFFSDSITILLYGEDYSSAGVLLSLMATRLFFTNFGTARQAYIIIENLQKYAILTLIVGTCTNIILNLFLIQQYGAKGAIIATILSWFVTIFAIDAFYSYTRKNFWLQVKSILTFYKIKLG